MRPPKVSRALLNSRAKGEAFPPVQVVYPSHHQPGRPDAPTLPARRPLGILPDALPELWLSKTRDGALWVMQESPSGPVCLATIAPEVLAHLVASKVPQPLEVK